MIINTGARTDAVQYYTPWLLCRFEEGHALARNLLFPNQVTRYELNPTVAGCAVFCLKDYWLSCRTCTGLPSRRREPSMARPGNPLLIGHLLPEDTMTKGVQRSLLARGD